MSYKSYDTVSGEGGKADFSRISRSNSLLKHLNLIDHLKVPYTHTHTHTYIYTYTHTYIHTYIHTLTHTTHTLLLLLLSLLSLLYYYTTILPTPLKLFCQWCVGYSLFCY
jgi:hypothetical protein